MAEIITPPCTRCCSPETKLQRIPNQKRHVTEYRVACEDCGLCGPISDSQKLAVRLFSRVRLGRHLRPQHDIYFRTNGEKGD